MSADRNDPKVLVVDDDPDTLRMIQLVLTSKGYAVVTAATGVEALQKVQAEQPDLLILDVMMPNVSGIEVCQKLRAAPATSNLPIIMLSARAQVADKVSGLQAGADEYVTKPIASAELVARVEALLERTRRLLRAAGTTRLGRVITFIGAKGGVGTTTVAFNVAALLAQERKSVIALELRPRYGTLARQLKQTPLANLGSLLRLEAGQINERELTACLFPASPQLKVLFGPQKVDEFQEIGADRAEAIIKGLAGMADYVIVDLPGEPSLANQVAVRHCHFVALVVEPEPACVSSGLVVLELLKSWGVSGNLIGAVVVNRAPLTATMDLRQIRAQLGCEIVGLVPYAADAHLVAQQAGVPLVLYQRDSLATESLAQIARLLAADRAAVRQ